MSKPSTPQLDAMLDLHIYGVMQEGVKSNTRTALKNKGWVFEDPNGDFGLTDEGYTVIGAVPPVHASEQAIEAAISAGEGLVHPDEPLADWEIELLGTASEDEKSPASKMPDVWYVVPNREDNRRKRRTARAQSRLNTKNYDQRVKRWGVGNVVVRVQDAA